MAFDLAKALEKVPADKRAALEAALKESQGFIEVLDAQTEQLKTESETRQKYEDELNDVAEKWKENEEEYKKVFALWSSTDDEKKEAQKKLDDAAKELRDTKAKLADAIKPISQVDTSKFVTQETLNNLEAGRAGYFAKVLKIQRDHAKLFPDQELDPEKFLLEAIASKKSPEDFWNETYKVGEKRAAMAKAEQEKHDQEVENRGYQKRLEEERNPALRTLGASDDPFYIPKEAAGKEPWETDQNLEIPEAQQLVKELSTRVQ